MQSLAYGCYRGLYLSRVSANVLKTQKIGGNVEFGWHATCKLICSCTVMPG